MKLTEIAGVAAFLQQRGQPAIPAHAHDDRNLVLPGLSMERQGVNQNMHIIVEADIDSVDVEPAVGIPQEIAPFELGRVLLHLSDIEIANLVELRILQTQKR